MGTRRHVAPVNWEKNHLEPDSNSRRAEAFHYGPLRPDKMGEPRESTESGDEQAFNCLDEANAIIQDVKAHVAEICVSSKLASDATQIYLNIRTIESATCCVQVTSRGFKIVSSQYDTIDEDPRVSALLRNGEADKQDEEEEEIFETPYALLDKISPRYVESFGNQLCQQLRQLQQMRTEFHEEDEEEEEEE
ncbi:GSK3-beta interaction protein [Drosophila bipectinata]|uniref:GSK3-beta interaction protein n=1 Tax=Drosophila bipectinata TaxID=42026 RepID=UPI001C8AE617|nr:GSK3-beta interaction protein [Drosophila bipectinata]